MSRAFNAPLAFGIEHTSADRQVVFMDLRCGSQRKETAASQGGKQGTLRNDSLAARPVIQGVKQFSRCTIIGAAFKSQSPLTHGWEHPLGRQHLTNNVSQPEPLEPHLR